MADHAPRNLEPDAPLRAIVDYVCHQRIDAPVALRAARTQTEGFERDFWAGGDLQALYNSAVNNRHNTGALERIFESGMGEFLKARERSNDAGALLDAYAGQVREYMAALVPVFPSRPVRGAIVFSNGALVEVPDTS